MDVWRGACGYDVHSGRWGADGWMIVLTSLWLMWVIATSLPPFFNHVGLLLSMIVCITNCLLACNCLFM